MSETAINTLKERLASGEIGQEEYERTLELLQKSSSGLDQASNSDATAALGQKVASSLLISLLKIISISISCIFLVALFGAWRGHEETALVFISYALIFVFCVYRMITKERSYLSAIALPLIGFLMQGAVMEIVPPLSQPLFD